MAAILAALAAPEIPALIGALTQSGMAIFNAIQQANSINLKPDPTPADFAALDAALAAALDHSTLLQASLAASRVIALNKIGKPAATP